MNDAIRIARLKAACRDFINLYQKASFSSDQRQAIDKLCFVIGEVIRLTVREEGLLFDTVEAD
jgi:hypothetical protein